MYRCLIRSRVFIDFIILSNGTDKIHWTAPPAAPARKGAVKENSPDSVSKDFWTSPYVVNKVTPTVALATINGK